MKIQVISKCCAKLESCSNFLLFFSKQDTHHIHIRHISIEKVHYLSHYIISLFTHNSNMFNTLHVQEKFRDKIKSLLDIDPQIVSVSRVISTLIHSFAVKTEINLEVSEPS